MTGRSGERHEALRFRFVRHRPPGNSLPRIMARPQIGPVMAPLARAPCTGDSRLPLWFSRYLDKIVASPAVVRYSMTSFMTT